jgi:hypothetical protein
MKQFIVALPYVLVSILVGTATFLIGRYLFPFQGGDKETLTSRSIVQSIAKQGFLVTQTVIAEQKVSYTVDKGSDWSNFWWGHEVTARATTSTAYGIELGGLSDSAVIIYSLSNQVCFQYPKAMIQSTALVSEIEVEAKSGILKKLLASDTNNDYNLALDMIKKEAIKSVDSTGTLEKDAYKQADIVVGFLLSKSGFTITDSCRN